MEPRWLDWARRLQALAHNGLTFCENQFDRERYEQLHRIALEIAAAGSGLELGPVAGLLALEPGYATPKVDVRGVVFDESGRVLLVCEKADGGWTLPGGFAEIGDSPAGNCEREVREESGYLVKAVRLLAVYDRTRHGHLPPHPHHIYKLFFRCELTGGAAAISHETTGVGWYAENELPPLSLGRTTPDQLARMFAHYRRPGLPAEFD